MMHEPQPIPFSALENLPKADERAVNAAYEKALAGFTRKIVVLDDDPTGVQTVHDVSIYTSWEMEDIRAGFAEEGRMFFLMTNSRGFTRQQTIETHQLIAKRLHAVSQETGKPFVLVSRGDSTLRGHYPIETQTVRETLESLGEPPFDGEILLPFFMEGGRYTLHDIHYVREGEQLTPAGLTEFARDKSFSYKESNLPRWCEEKTEGAYPARDVLCVPIEMLRACDVAGVEEILLRAKGFGKIIVNAAAYSDVKVLVAAYCGAVARGKSYLFRSAAAVPKVLGGVSDRPLLSRAELIDPQNRNGGVIIVGSHVNKTTRQLEALRQSGLPIAFIEFNQHRVLEENGLEQEAARVTALAETCLESGQTVAVFTRRERLDLDTDDRDLQLRISVQISDAVTSVVSNLKARPSFIIAKGGITSSDVGVKALRVKRAVVMGQLSPGIPVWMTGPESKFPHMPYVIFPGNVGDADTLRRMVAALL